MAFEHKALASLSAVVLIAGVWGPALGFPVSPPRALADYALVSIAIGVLALNFINFRK